MVSVPVAEHTIALNAIRSHDVTSWVTRNREILTLPDVYAGIWLDHLTGTVYLDASVRYPTLNDALDAAGDYGQLAVYDVARKREVSVLAPLEGSEHDG